MGGTGAHGPDDVTDQAARLAHALHAVRLWADSTTVAHDVYQRARDDVRKVLAAARDDQQVTDPYELAAVMADENERLRGALRRIRDREEPTPQELAHVNDEMGDEVPDYAPDYLVIATAVLAELDPLAPEPDHDTAPDGRPVLTLALPTEDQR